MNVPTISKEWTEKERLELIAILAMNGCTRHTAPELVRMSESIHIIATWSSQLLESVRDAVLAEVMSSVQRAA